MTGCALRAAGGGLEQQLLGQVAFRGILVDPVARRRAQVEQQVHLVALHLADRGCEVVRVDAHEVHVARADEGMQPGIERGVGRRDHVDLEQRARLAAEDDRECDDEREREQEVEDERRAVAQELEVPRMPDGQQAAEVHVRSSRPVSSRKRSSRLRGRIRSRLSGTPRPEQCLQGALDVAGRDLDAVARDQDGQGKVGRLAAEVLARQLQDDVVEVLLEQPRRRSLGDDAGRGP